MVNDFVLAMGEIGLRINAKKCAWMIDAHNWERWCERKLFFDGNWVSPVKELKVLGSMLAFDASEVPAITHRIA